MILNYLKWCWRMKEILPWQVALVSDEPLTQEDYDYPELWAAEHGMEPESLKCPT